MLSFASSTWLNLSCFYFYRSAALHLEVSTTFGKSLLVSNPEILAWKESCRMVLQVSVLQRSNLCCLSNLPTKIVQSVQIHCHTVRTHVCAQCQVPPLVLCQELIFSVLINSGLSSVFSFFFPKRSVGWRGSVTVRLPLRANNSSFYQH